MSKLSNQAITMVLILFFTTVGGWPEYSSDRSRANLKPKQNQNQSYFRITFDTQLKTVLKYSHVSACFPVFCREPVTSGSQECDNLSSTELFLK